MWVAQLVGGFIPQSRHLPRLWVRSQVGYVPNHVSLSHWCFSLSLSPSSLPLSLKSNEKMSLGEDFFLKFILPYLFSHLSLAFLVSCLRNHCRIQDNRFTPVFSSIILNLIAQFSLSSFCLSPYLLITSINMQRLGNPTKEPSSQKGKEEERWLTLAFEF